MSSSGDDSLIDLAANDNPHTISVSVADRNFGNLSAMKSPKPNDHACLVYVDRSEFVPAAVRFLAAGLALNQRLIYVSDAEPPVLARELSGLGNVGKLVESGVLVLCPLAGFCEPAGVIADAQVAKCEQLMLTAVEDGFLGVRFAADVTMLAVPPLSWMNHLRWEQLVDSYMDGHPMSALCGYSARLIDRTAAAALSCVHPLRDERRTHFGFFWRNGWHWLDGELDSFELPTLRSCLDLNELSGDVHIDGSSLRFLDGASCAELAEIGRSLNSEDRQLVVHGGPSTLGRLREVLGFRDDFVLENG